MMPALLLGAAGLAAYGGFACLALAMPEHWARASGEESAVSPHRPLLRPLGFTLLAAAYLLCFWRDGAAFGSVLWIVLGAAAGMAVAFTLTWRPRLLLPTRRR
jgi:hypothetical protein